MKPNVGISDKNLKAVNSLLSIGLANAVLLYTKARKFHWNVSGNSFMELHKLFEHHYTELETAIDEIAERISKFGFKVPGTMKEFLELTTLAEMPGKDPDQQGMIKELMKDHEAIIISLRKAIDDCDDKYSDKGTADFLTGLMLQHETLAWTLRRYLS